MSPTVEAIEERVMMNCVYYTYFMGCSKVNTPYFIILNTRVHR